MYYYNTVTGAIFLIQQYELIFRYHFLFCVLLNGNTSYRSFSGFLTSLRISKVKGEAHQSIVVLFYFRFALTATRGSGGSLSQRRNPSLYRFLRFLDYLRLNYQKMFSYNQPFLVFKTQKSA